MQDAALRASPAATVAPLAEDPVGRVVNAIHTDLVFGELKPRQRLVESELTSRYGVTRSVVRRVLDELEARGIVSRPPNKGAVVHDFRLKEVRDICDVRVLLHRHAVESLPLPADPAWLDALRALQAEHAAFVEMRDVGEAYRLNKEFHRQFFAATPNAFLRKQIAEVDWLMDVVRSYRMLGPALNDRAPREHAEIIEAAASCDRARLLQLCLDHVPSPEEIYDRIGSWGHRDR